MFLTRARAPALARNALLGAGRDDYLLQSGFQTLPCLVCKSLGSTVGSKKVFECHGAIHFSEIDVDMPSVCPPADDGLSTCGVGTSEGRY